VLQEIYPKISNEENNQHKWINITHYTQLQHLLSHNYQCLSYKTSINLLCYTH